MRLNLTLTKHAGGVVITGDKDTLSKIERLLTHTAMTAHNCDENGVCMRLSRYFEGNNREVDWVTLTAGVGGLRNSVGYWLSRENSALIGLLEYLIFDALFSLLPNTIPEIERALDSISSFSDKECGHLLEGRVVYLYQLKTAEFRKLELLAILYSLNPHIQPLSQNYTDNLKNLRYKSLVSPSRQTHQYPL